MEEKTFKLQIENKDINLESMFGNYVSNYNNYVAKICDRHKEYKFNRKFLKMEKFDDIDYIKLASIDTSCLYEFRATKNRYNKGNRIDMNILAKVVEITENEVVFEELSEREAVNFLENKNTDTDKSAERQAVKEKFNRYIDLLSDEEFEDLAFIKKLDMMINKQRHKSL